MSFVLGELLMSSWNTLSNAGVKAHKKISLAYVLVISCGVASRMTVSNRDVFSLDRTREEHW